MKRRTKTAKRKTVKKAVKKKVVKKKAVKKKKSKVDPQLEPFTALFEEFKQGTRVSDLARKGNVKRPLLRRMFQKLAGGKEGYRVIMSTFTKFTPPGRKGGEQKRPDDSAVRWVRSTKLRQSWQVWNRSDGDEIFCEPVTWIFYRRADEYETADVIIPGPFGDTRLRKDPQLESLRPRYEKWLEEITRARAIRRGEDPGPSRTTVTKKKARKERRVKRKNKRKSQL